jgi:molybdenum cofactor cytidylyltransferase
MNGTIPCGALLLAAGRSTRMGSHKLLETLDGKPLVTHAADAALAAGLPLLVVTGHRAAEVEAALAGRTLTTAHAADHALGLAHSLNAGLTAAPPHWEAALILLADMPRLAPALLARLAATPGIAVPVHQGRRGNPVRWPRAHWPALLRLQGDSGARRLLETLPVIEVEAPNDSIFLDIDTPEALAALRSKR